MTSQAGTSQTGTATVTGETTGAGNGVVVHGLGIAAETAKGVVMANIGTEVGIATIDATDIGDDIDANPKKSMIPFYMINPAQMDM